MLRESVRTADFEDNQFDSEIKFYLSFAYDREDDPFHINGLNIDDIKILKALIDEHLEILKKEGVEV